VHPVMLAYRRDLVEELGIDVSQLETWDDFVAMGQKITADLDGDGALDRYALELHRNGNWSIWTLLRQQGVDLFDAQGEVAFNGPVGVDTVMWYLRQTRGPRRIAYDTGGSNSGQPFFRALMDGLMVFVFCPDWRSYQIQTDAAKLKGKMGLIPLPAWQKGGRRTSTWGMTGLTLSKTSKNPELAWQLAKFLYFNPADLGARFQDTNILPPLKEAWSLPAFQQPNEFYGGQRLGVEYAQLAPHTPAVYASPVYKSAQNKLDQAITRSGIYFEQHGEQGLRQKVKEELDRAAGYLKIWSDRHGRLASAEAAGDGAADGEAGE
jgi:arabinosaccharide transport system substrate-binding protein